MTIEELKKKLKEIRLQNLRWFDAGLIDVDCSLLEFICANCAEQRDAIHLFGESS